MFKCEHCEKELSSKMNLKIHQTTAKYCLLIQKRDPPIINEKCNYCEKVYQHKQKRDLHELTCVEKLTIERIKNEQDKIKFNYETIIIPNKQMEYENTIRELKEEINRLKIEAEATKGEIFTSLFEKEREINKIQSNKLLDKSGTVTTTNIKAKNVVMNALNLNLSAERLEALKPTYTMAHYEAGGKGQAEWVVPNILTDENGNSLYKCSDRNRKNFFYNNSEGEHIADTHAAKLKDAIRPILESKLKEYKRSQCSELMSIEDEDESNAAMEKLNSLYKENKSLGAEFDKRLVELTYG